MARFTLPRDLYHGKGAQMLLAWERGSEILCDGAGGCFTRGVVWGAGGEEGCGQRQDKKGKEIKGQVFFNRTFSEIYAHWRDSLSFCCISW